MPVEWLFELSPFTAICNGTWKTYDVVHTINQRRECPLSLINQHHFANWIDNLTLILKTMLLVAYSNIKLITLDFSLFSSNTNLKNEWNTSCIFFSLVDQCIVFTLNCSWFLLFNYRDIFIFIRIWPAPLPLLPLLPQTLWCYSSNLLHLCSLTSFNCDTHNS